MAAVMCKAPLRVRRTLAFGAAAFLVLGGTGCAIDLSHLRSGGEAEPDPEPELIEAEPIAAAALAELAELPALRISGQMAEGATDPWEVALMAAGSGAVSGTFTDEETELEFMEVDGGLYLLADDSYWLAQGTGFNVDAEDYPDNWVRGSTDRLGFDPAAVLAPGELAEILEEQAAGGEAVATEDEVEGTPAYRIALEGGEMWASVEEPHRLLRIQIAELAALDAAEDAVRTDVVFERPEAAEIEEFYEGLLTEAEDLGGARDSRFDVGWSDDITLDCVDGGTCTVVGTLTDLSAGGEEGDSTRVRMDATVGNSALGEKTCSDTQTLESGGSAEVSCTVDFSAELASHPTTETFDMEGEALPSTRALSGGQVEELMELLEEQQEETLERAGTGADDGDAEDDGDPEDDGDDGDAE